MMTWRRVTLILLALCVGICAWTYLRDKDGPVVREPQRVDAQLDANWMLASLTTQRRCLAGCTAQVLGRIGSSTWRVKLAVPGWRQCFNVDVSSFGQAAGHGFSGVRAARCNA